MTTGTKTLDAIELKTRLQENLREKLAGLSDEERLAALRELARSGPLANWWKELKPALTAS